MAYISILIDIYANNLIYAIIMLGKNKEIKSIIKII
jgi:hypothetical protein